MSIVAGVGVIAAVAQAAESEECEEDKHVAADGEGAFPGAAFHAFIEERKARKEEGDNARNDYDSKERERAGPIFEPLKDWDVIPLGAGQVVGVSRVGLGP